jgi:hypothetical protein
MNHPGQAAAVRIEGGLFRDLEMSAALWED